LCKKLPGGELYESETFQNWFARWQNRLKKEKQELETSYVLMRSLNPAIIPRNHKVEEALQAGEKGDFEPLYALLHAIEKPYQNGEHLLPYQSPPRPEEKVLQTFCGT
jgi:uncharacterized protein YdiU (UPF0061 family)